MIKQITKEERYNLITDEDEIVNISPYWATDLQTTGRQFNPNECESSLAEYLNTIKPQVPKSYKKFRVIGYLKDINQNSRFVDCHWLVELNAKYFLYISKRETYDPFPSSTFKVDSYWSRKFKEKDEYRKIITMTNVVAHFNVQIYGTPTQ